MIRLVFWLLAAVFSLGCGESAECEQLADCCEAISLDCALSQSADGCATTLDVIRTSRANDSRPIPDVCLNSSGSTPDTQWPAAKNKRTIADRRTNDD